MNQQVQFGLGCVNLLQQTLQNMNARNIFLVTGKESYISSGVKAVLDDLLEPYQITLFDDFNTNPKIDDIELGLTLFQSGKYDLILAVGGGSVIDSAKIIKVISAQDSSAIDIIKNSEKIINKSIPMIAIPTTAGSGSEATHFAVVYIEKMKYSVSNEYMLPNIVFIDPGLTESMPDRLTAVSGMDALCQAVESYWSVNSTDKSKADSSVAIKMIFSNLEEAVLTPSITPRYMMCIGSYLAGRAINVSRTTAPHAVSYTLTSNFGVSHGQAASLTLGEFLVYNSNVTDDDVVDSRGTDYVRKSISELCEIMGEKSARKTSRSISGLMERIRLETRLSDLGINNNNDIQLIVDNVNTDRLLNNPRRVSKEPLLKILQNIT